MNPKTYLKLEERYKAHLKFKRYSTRYRCQKITDVFSYLKFLYANDYPLTEFLNEHLQEFTDITYKEYSEEYARTRIRHVNEFREWYIQYIETLFYHQEFYKEALKGN